MIDNFIEDLKMNQEDRKKQDFEVFQKIEDFLKILKKYKNGDKSVLPFHFILDDPSGNSHISNPFAPLPDNNLKEEHYIRTKEQLNHLGFIGDQEMPEKQEIDYKEKKILKTQ